MASLVDTHAHLDDPDLWNRLGVTVERAEAAGVGRILAVGSELESSRRAVEAARRFSIVYAAVGVHPHDAERFDRDREEVEALLDEEKVVAVGEIGLDYFRERSSREHQLQAFEAQLRWARDRDLPASIHNREADGDVLDRIEAAGASVVMHAFSAAAEVAERALRMGAMISFAGNVTYPNSDGLREVARMVPVDRILTETDAPVLAPQQRRGRTNEPAYVAFTLECLAQVRNTNLDVLLAHVGENAASVFRWDRG